MEEGDKVSSEFFIDETALNEVSLQAQVLDAERILEDLERELQGIDSEIEALAQKSHQFELVSQICRSLEELDSMGASGLFWEGSTGAQNRAEHLRYVYSRIEEHESLMAEIADRRNAVLDKIDGENRRLDVLHYDIQEAIERDERRKNEWLVERDVIEMPSRRQIMPWTRGTEEDQRFRRSLAAAVLVSIIAGMLVSVIDLPIPERDKLTEVPERVAKLVREERKPPPPPEPVIEEPQLTEEEPPEPEQVAEEQPPEELPKTVEEPVVAQVPQPDTREQVKSKGILAFRESFAQRANLKPTAQLGSQARVSNAGETAVGRPERAMVTSSAPGSSGGINLADISRDVGGDGGAIQGVQVSQVASSIGGLEGADRPLSGGMAAGRTDEEIQIVFDRYKAALYRLYNRELRKNPTLRGQMILRLTIEPDGTVSLCQVQSSDMNAPVLADQVVDRVRTFDFGAKDVAAMTIIYPIDFLPAA